MSLPTTYSQGGPYQIPQEPRSRLSAMQFNVGNLLRNPVSSSVYSRSPDATATPTTRVPQQTTARMPQLPQFAFMRRERAPTDEEHHAVLQSTISADTRRSSMSSANHSQLDHSPVNRISLWRDQPQPITVALGVPTHHFDTRPRARGEEDGAVLPDRHPADVPLDPETEELANMVRHKRKRKGCRRCRRGAWVRKANGRPSLWSDRSTRGKCFACLISGIFLVILLGVYLSIALTKSNLGSELHVLFILAIIGTTVFFTHALIRLCMVAFRPNTAEGRGRNRIPSMCGPEGFQPDEPIRVHVAGDDDVEDGEEEDAGHVEGDTASGEKVKVPPPAYGLWRSSVRIQPNLLHWQRIDNPSASTEPPSSSSSAEPSARNSPVMQQRENANTGPRPPSYASDDGVDYVVSAQPRSTVYMPDVRPPSQLHPALRGY